MWNSIKHLDRLLRGDATNLNELRGGMLNVPVVGLTFLIVVLGMIYGACMGLFAILGSGSGKWVQIPASMAKVPALFLLTLVVTFPSLYVFNALVGSRLSMLSLLRLLIASLGVMMALLASFGTITVFFAVSTDSYAFMVLLNVVLFAVAGFMGLGFLLQTLHRLFNAQILSPPPIPLPSSVSPENPEELPPAVENYAPHGALDVPEGQVSSRNVRSVFRIWVLVFGLVGAQMGWVMRPFIGDPSKPFTFFRERESNFFQDVLRKTGELLSWDSDGADRWDDSKSQRGGRSS
jgi:hypothetical protein